MNLSKKIIVLALISLVTIGAFAQNVLDGAYIKENSPKRRVIPYTSLREADVVWSKRVWREIDLREKINHPLYFPLEAKKDRKALIIIIKEALIDGRLTAYGNALTDDQFNLPMTKSEVEALFVKVDTLFRENPDTGEQEKVPQKIELGAEDIIKYQVKEDWFFDKQRSVLDVRIIGICPLRISKSDNGDVKGFSPMFWIYFPEARPVFSTAEVYNRRNDEERRTFEDIFWKRQFNSYIIKESNVYDRLLSEYKKDTDLLLESERIKAEIFNWEHDLWHF